jgi:hypothetical protein
MHQLLTIGCRQDRNGAGRIGIARIGHPT